MAWKAETYKVIYITLFILTLFIWMVSHFKVKTSVTVKVPRVKIKKFYI